MGLFTDIYNTVARFFRTQEGQIDGDPSKSVAQNRLKLVLMQDRTNLTPKVLEQMRGELVDLLSKYLEMDKDLLELNFEHEGDQVALMLSIPVIRAKDEDEIEKALGSESCNEDDDNECQEENSEEVVESSETTKKPRKRRSKKVTPPEEFEASNEESSEECINNEEFHEEQQENEVVCENSEG